MVSVDDSTAGEQEPHVTNSNRPPSVDLLLHDARLVATLDEGRRELPGGWIAISDGVITGVGSSSEASPPADVTISAEGCLVTPGLINTHHHLFQNLTRAWPPMTGQPLFGWLESLYPTWTAHIDEEAVFSAAWVGLAELALSGCTTSSDHHYLHPVRAGDLLAARFGLDGQAVERSAGGRDLGCDRARPALPPDLRIDEPLEEGRRPAPRRRRS